MPADRIMLEENCCDLRQCGKHMPKMKPDDPAANMENLARWPRLAAEQGADLIFFA